MFLWCIVWISKSARCQRAKLINTKRYNTIQCNALNTIHDATDNLATFETPENLAPFYKFFLEYMYVVPMKDPYFCLIRRYLRRRSAVGVCKLMPSLFNLSISSLSTITPLKGASVALTEIFTRDYFSVWPRLDRGWLVNVWIKYKYNTAVLCLSWGVFVFARADAGPTEAGTHRDRARPRRLRVSHHYNYI